MQNFITLYLFLFLWGGGLQNFFKMQKKFFKNLFFPFLIVIYDNFWVIPPVGMLILDNNCKHLWATLTVEFVSDFSLVEQNPNKY